MARNDGTPWIESDLALLRQLYADESNATLGRIFGRSLVSVKNKAQQMGLRKSDAYQASGKGQFVPGQQPWNKGLHFSPAGSEKGRFKPGQKPANAKPVGHERVTKDGYLQRKMTDTGYTPGDYRMVHHLAWEAHHACPVPKGHAVIFRDGNRRNFDPANLELITRGELMRRNSYHTHLPPELVQIVQLRGALTRKINRRRKQA